MPKIHARASDGVCGSLKEAARVSLPRRAAGLVGAGVVASLIAQLPLRGFAPVLSTRNVFVWRSFKMAVDFPCRFAHCDGARSKSGAGKGLERGPWVR